ncbi:hypothetical protein [Nesterenkonia pannonica]|uniref:hypothetical protein n=1 Tax=Nesterenkonia pannonica TaxID=1548602 RepID=UPI00216482D8|nr:hypothetical protein [Nesterenkonia pannonica]
MPSFEEQDSSEPEANDEPDSGASTELITYPQADSGEVAPIPASRRARRLLRETSSIPRLDEDMLAELDELTSEIKLHDDPENVDPELLRRQQAFAAKAMQANQARLRQEQAEREAREAEERRWRRHHPRSPTSLLPRRSAMPWTPSTTTWSCRRAASNRSKLAGPTA